MTALYNLVLHAYIKLQQLVLAIHRIEEIVIALSIFQFINQEFHSIYVIHRIDNSAQHPHFRARR